MPVRGLTIVLADASPARFRAALTLAAAQAALGGSARLFLQGEAVSALRPPIRSVEDERHEQAGLPTLAELFEDAVDLGVELIACQSGLALTATDASTLDLRIAYGGIVSIMQSLDEDRLIVV